MKRWAASSRLGLAAGYGPLTDRLWAPRVAKMFG